MENLKIVYHKDDFDGVCSAAIVWNYYKKFWGDGDIELVGITYTDEFNPDDYKGYSVVMVDFAPQPFIKMVKLKEVCDALIWIDHHSHAINDYMDSGVMISGIRDINFAACQLSWKYFFSDVIPNGIDLLGYYDIWEHDKMENIIPFQYGMKCIDGAYDPKNSIWEKITRHHMMGYGLGDIIDNGKVVERFLKNENIKLITDGAFSMDIDGYSAICVNSPGGSKVFDDHPDRDTCDIMVTYQAYNNKDMVLSLYSDKVDVGAIAKKYGGGGHKCAAGFSIPFSINIFDE